MKGVSGLWLLVLQQATCGLGRPGLSERQEEGQQLADASQNADLPDPSEMPADENERLKSWWYYNVPQQPAGGKPRPQWIYKENPDWYGETTVSSPASTSTSEGAAPTEQAEAHVGLKAEVNEKSGDIDIALSPGMSKKIEAAFKDAPPCTGDVAEGTACGLAAALLTLSKDKEAATALQQTPGILAETIDRIGVVGEGEVSLLAPEAIKALGLTAASVNLPDLLLAIGGIASVSIISQLYNVYNNGGSTKVVDPIIGIPTKDVSRVGVESWIDKLKGGSGSETEEGGDEQKTCVDSEDLADWPFCYDSDCSGQGDDGKKCTAEGDNKGCSCLEKLDVDQEPRNEAALQIDTQKTFDSTKINSPECQTDAREKFGAGVFQGMASVFCNTHLEKEESADVSPADLLIGNAHEPNVTFSRKNSKDDCVMDCIGMSQRLLKDCNDDSGLSHGGKVTDECGELSYKFEGGESQEQPDPDPTPESKPEDQAPPAKEDPSCPDQASTFPARVFNSDTNKMFLDFCGAWKKEENSEMIVDSQGYRKEIGEAPPKRLKRVPPPPNGDLAKPEDLPEWRARLFYEKSDNGGECSMTCEEAYESLSTCRTSQTGSLGFQYRQGSINAGCGRFLYHLYKFDVDWKGAGLCNTGPTDEDFCDQSVGKIDDGKLYTTDGDGGTCRGNTAGYGCGSFLQASGDHKCEAYGYEMKFYRKMFKATGAKVCGSVHYDDGCMLTFNRVTGCKN